MTCESRLKLSIFSKKLYPDLSIECGVLQSLKPIEHGRVYVGRIGSRDRRSFEIVGRACGYVMHATARTQYMCVDISCCERYTQQLMSTHIEFVCCVVFCTEQYQ